MAQKWTHSKQLRMPDGTRKWVYANGARALQARIVEARAEWAERPRNKAQAERTVADLLTYWIENVKALEVEPNTLRKYRSYAEHHLIPAFGARRLGDLQVADVQAMMKAHLDAGLAPGTIKNIRALLSHALGYALETREWGVEINVASFARAPKGTRRTAGFPLTEDEADRLGEGLPGTKYEAEITTILWMALRVGEALGLAWADIDFDKGLVNVGHNLQREGGKFVLRDHGKTESASRLLPLMEPLVPVLLAHRERQQGQRRALLAEGFAWGNEWDLVFTNTTGDPVWSEMLLRGFKDLCLDLGIAERRIHDLRHTTATLLRKRGVPLDVISVFLGHSSYSITSDIYIYKDPELLREAVNSLRGPSRPPQPFERRPARIDHIDRFQRAQEPPEGPRSDG